MKIIKLVTMCCLAVLLCSKIQCMDTDDKKSEPDKLAQVQTLNEAKLDSTESKHPGALFNQDPTTKHWMARCQGCKNWLMSTRTPYEPQKKTIDSTEDVMQRFHIKTCSWKPTL